MPFYPKADAIVVGIGGTWLQPNYRSNDGLVHIAYALK